MKKYVTLSVILFSVFSLVALEANNEEAVVRKITGYAEYSEPGSTEFKPLQLSRRLKIGSTVKTAEDSEVILRIVPGAAMKIAAKTTITLDSMAYEKNGDQLLKREANINLSEGTVSALLDKGDPKVTDFKITTPQGSAAARGTFYAVAVENGNAFVKVQEGKVGVIESKKEEKASE